MLHSTRALSLTGGASSEAFQLSGNQIIPYCAAGNVQLKHEWEPSYASGRICDCDCDYKVVIAPPNLKFEPDFPHPASARPVGTTLPARQAPPLGQTFPLRDSHLFSDDVPAFNPHAFCELTASLRAQGHEVPQSISAIQADLSKCIPSIPLSGWAVCIVVPRHPPRGGVQFHDDLARS
jgi:hypothetical protein